MIRKWNNKGKKSLIVALTYDEWVLKLLENLLLVFNMINMLAVNDFLLLHGLNGELVVRVVFQPCKLDISKGA